MAPDHPNVMGILARRGELHLVLQEHAQASELLLRCLNLREKILGRDHPEVAVVLTDLAILHARTGEEVKAADLYERAVQILRADPVANALYLGLTLTSLGMFHGVNHRWTDAAKALEESLRLLQITFGDSHPIRGQLMLRYAAVLRKCKRKKLAESYEEQARAILREGTETDLARHHTVDIRTLRAAEDR
jgi:tetratricopeptide (TPR) repeat protein